MSVTAFVPARTSSFIPRDDRDLLRGRAAADRVRAAGGTAMEAALAHIAESFSAAAIPNELKRKVQAVLQGRVSRAEQWARYGMFADALHGPLPCAIDLVEMERRCELFELEQAARNPFARKRPRLRIAIISEFRLLLRWMRRHAPETWDAIREAEAVTCAQAAE